MPVRGIPAALEPTVTMQPDFRVTISGATLCETWKTPVVFTAKVSAQSCAESPVAGPVRRMPATFTRTSTGPSSRSTRATVFSTATRSVTSIT
ncbi:hypothetical protein SMICM304S_03078 [Streptomyces microflavus]